MKAPRWTPGPWEPNGCAIETVATPATVIGRAFDERDDCGIESESEALANAALIAAAPELYGELSAVREICAKYLEGDTCEAVVESIDRILAKARGEAP